jgi:hypothetical protein
MPRTSPLTIEQVLVWADAHFARTGQWPTTTGGPVHEDPAETWQAISQAMYHCRRGFQRPKYSLAQLLADQRDKRNPRQLPDLTVEQILTWVAEHVRRTGQFPEPRSGPIPRTNETWAMVASALRYGRRGLQQSSLHRLMKQVRDELKVPTQELPTLEQVLGWADAHKARTGEWPTKTSGAIAECDKGYSWHTISQWLWQGWLGPQLTLPDLFKKERGVRRPSHQPALTIPQILTWADQHQERTGKWPNAHSGTIVDAPGETWEMVNYALVNQGRGLQGGLSLIQLLVQERGVRSRFYLPPLTKEQVCQWVRDYRTKHGCWPEHEKGPIEGSDGETWSALRGALWNGKRGFAWRTTFRQLCGEE